jgi:hypothetical protein
VDELLRHALSKKTKELGPRHPGLVPVITNLAKFLHETGDNSEAEALLRRAFEIDEMTVDPDRPSIRTSLHNLANFFEKSGKVAEREAI